jgi:hypothetical protein
MAESVGATDECRLIFNGELDLNHDFLMIENVNQNILIGGA